jgi:hypothetical protein
MMAMNRTHLRALTALLIGVMLLAQMVVTAYLCPATSAALASASGVGVRVGASVPAAHALASLPLAAADMPDCPGMGAQGADSNNPNVCVEHCRYGQQGDQASSLTLGSTVLLALYAVRPQAPLSMGTRGMCASTLSALVAASVPHTVLHCCFRI